MRLSRYFPIENEAYAFASGLEEANDGNIHTVTVCKSIDYADQYVVTWHNEARKPAELPEDNPPLTPQEYVAHKGAICPICRGSNLGGHGIDINNAQAFRLITCLNPDCEAYWTDCYELSGYDDLKS